MAGAPRGSRQARSSHGSSSHSDSYAIRDSNRSYFVIVIFIVAALGLFIRLFQLQVILAPEYSEAAGLSRTNKMMVEPRRGTIYDRNGHVLAISVEAKTVYANPSEVAEPQATARAIAEVLGGAYSDYLDMLIKGQSPTFSYIARRIDVDKADKLAQLDLPGIYFLDDTRREYPYGQTGGQVVGACSVEVDQENNREYYKGICGLESYYDSILSGTVGYYESELGADGTPIPGGEHLAKAPVEGQDIVISIDIELQEELESDLKEGLKWVDVKSGSAVVMDYTNGEIYAAASMPFFNPADRSIVAEGSMQLKAVTQLLEPGSMFKTVPATAILEEGAMTPSTKIQCPSTIEADGYIVSDAHERKDTVYSLREIIAQSSNVGISLSVEDFLGFDKFYDYILKYRFRELTGIDYPGEPLGYMVGFDQWSRVVGYNVSFGQGISMNSMQIVSFYGALQNNGVAQTPHFLVRKPQTGEVPTYEEHEIIENKDAIEPMVDMLEAVVEEGTGEDAAIEGFSVAGKTSTAEIYDEVNGGYRDGWYEIGFAGFLPDSTSRFVCLCEADEVPAMRSVTPMFHDIMVHVINRYNITSTAAPEEESEGALGDGYETYE